MKLLIDENLPVVIVELARRQKIEASSVRDELPGAPDLKILERLQSTGETLVTRDIRFANHVLEQIAIGKPLGGAILIREQKMEAMRKAWERWLENPRTPRGIVVLTTKTMRFREYPGQRINR